METGYWSFSNPSSRYCCNANSLGSEEPAKDVVKNKYFRYKELNSLVKNHPADGQTANAGIGAIPLKPFRLIVGWFL